MDDNDGAIENAYIWHYTPPPCSIRNDPEKCIILRSRTKCESAYVRIMLKIRNTLTFYIGDDKEGLSNVKQSTYIATV